jgi:hypothetical protein
MRTLSPAAATALALGLVSDDLFGSLMDAPIAAAATPVAVKQRGYQSLAYEAMQTSRNDEKAADASIWN